MTCAHPIAGELGPLQDTHSLATHFVVTHWSPDHLISLKRFCGGHQVKIIQTSSH
jgi:hypothetical protein